MRLLVVIREDQLLVIPYLLMLHLRRLIILYLMTAILQFYQPKMVPIQFLIQ